MVGEWSLCIFGVQPNCKFIVHVMYKPAYDLQDQNTIGTHYSWKQKSGYEMAVAFYGVRNFVTNGMWFELDDTFFSLKGCSQYLYQSMQHINYKVTLPLFISVCLHSSRSKASSVSGTNARSPIVSSPFSFRSDERAAKRKEACSVPKIHFICCLPFWLDVLLTPYFAVGSLLFQYFSKLEEKFNTNETQKGQLQAQSKVFKSYFFFNLILLDFMCLNSGCSYIST